MKRFASRSLPTYLRHTEVAGRVPGFFFFCMYNIIFWRGDNCADVFPREFPHTGTFAFGSLVGKKIEKLLCSLTLFNFNQKLGDFRMVTAKVTPCKEERI